MNKALHIIGDIIHALQTERGSACLYTCQSESVLDDRLNAQFRQTDSSLTNYQKELSLWMVDRALLKPLFNKMTRLLERLDDLRAKRNATLSYDLAVADIIYFYTDQLVRPFINILVEIAFFDRANSPVRLTAYVNFLHWKEATGLERALGLYGVTAGSFNDEMYGGWLKSKISEQLSNRDLFLSLAEENQIQCLKPLIESPVTAKIEEINNAITDNLESDLLEQIDALCWFDILSQKINIMRKVEALLVDTLTEDVAKVGPEAPFIKIASQKQETLGGISSQDRRFLSDLPLFRNLTPSGRENLLKHVQIDTYQKGKVLFMEGEQATRLYVIFHGWVKLFKNSRSGEETILQLFSGGDTLAESAVFLNVPLLENAQVVEPARIMTIPAPIVREQVRNNNELAVNMLTSMSRISSNFMRQIECTRLKTADQRVGWFLLKMMLEQHRISHNFVDLPFDKAVMASFLDIKPETLSRSLKRFRVLGFEVGSDRIKLPQVGALCAFCDDQLAASCEKHKQATCTKVTS